MADFRETRSSAARWKEILIPTYNELIRLGASDAWVFGSQAMSLYMKRPLTSKDLDLLVSGMTMKIVEKLCNSLAPFSSSRRRPYYNFQNLEHEGRPNPVFSIYLNPENEKPFAIEFFQTYLGYDLRRLTPYATYIKRWGSEFQTLTVEAIIGTRLAFRPPGITSFNAERLNLFIKTVRRQIDWSAVEKFIMDFQFENRIEENLKDLRRRRIKIVDSDKLSFTFEKKVKRRRWPKVEERTTTHKGLSTAGSEGS